MKLLLLFIGVAMCMEAENSRLKQTNTALREALQSLEESIGFEMDIGQSEEYLAEQDAGHDFEERVGGSRRRSRRRSYTSRRRTTAPKINCVGSWSNWGSCSKKCGGGSKTRTYRISRDQSGGGSRCPYSNGQRQTASCNTKKCTTTTTTTTAAATGDYVLLRSNVECDDNANEFKMGTFDSVEECAEACKARDGCTNFIFGKMNKFGSCWDEGITESECTTWGTDEYDFYGFGKTGCVNVNYIYDNPGYYVCECVPYDDPCIKLGLCIAEDACPISDKKAVPNYICNAGYVDKTGGNANYWRCGSSCQGGKFYTDVYCGCACIPNPHPRGFELEMDIGQSGFTCSSSQLASVGPTNEACWDEEYPCDLCCSTGLGIDEESCWDDEKFTYESCCGSGSENLLEEAIGQRGCPEIKCMRFCEYGNIKDENGCDTCMCNELDPRKKYRDTGIPGESYRRCPKRNCPAVVCDFGFFKDKNGCDTCKCNDGRMSDRKN